MTSFPRAGSPTRHIRTPRATLALMAAAVLLCIVANLLTLWSALQTPWIGVSLAPSGASDGLLVRPAPTGPARPLGAQAVLLDLSTYTASNAIRLQPDDLTTDPDSFDSYADVDRFFARQDHIRALLELPVLMNWKDSGGELHQTIVTPGWRPLSSLPSSFWNRQAIASLAFLLVVGLWLRGAQDPRRRLLALAGAAVLLAVFPASIYGARELALSGSTFHMLWALNHAGATLFGCAIITLLGRYPQPLLGPRLLLALNLAFLAWLLADLLRVVNNPAWGYRVPLMLQTVLVIGLGTAQWLMKRRAQER